MVVSELARACGEDEVKAKFWIMESVVSMFSGVGGLDMGFEGNFKYMGKKYPALPFKIVAAYEMDAKCVETFGLNLRTPIWKRELSPKSIQGIPKANVLIGGFPCQDFSSCGPLKGLNSERGQLYKVMEKYLLTHQPKLFCAENVPNLARMENGSVLAKITSDFAACGYRVNVWDLYAPDFGVPQTRRRLFIVGVREDLTGFPEQPKATFENKPRSIEWAIDDLINISDETIPNQSQYFKASKAKKGNGQGDETSVREKPGYTVRANAKSRVHFHYELQRRLTVRECARLQTFPDEFRFPHSATTNIMQVGNAVPPILAHTVASQLARYLRKSGYEY